MRPLTRIYVDAAFRLLRIEEMVLATRSPTITLPDDLDSTIRSNGHDTLEMIAAFSTWAAEGARLVSLSEEMVQQLAATDPPGYEDGRIRWNDDNLTLMIEAGRYVLFAWMNDGRCQTVCYREGGTPLPEVLLDDRQAHVFLQSVLYILSTRPEGLIVTETTPSRKAARKAARKAGTVPAHLPSTLYVIGPDVPYQARERQRSNKETDREDRKDMAEGRTPRARHSRRGHFRRQHWGKKNANLKVIWIAPLMVGLGPVLVRAQRIETIGGAGPQGNGQEARLAHPSRGVGAHGEDRQARESSGL